MGNSATTIENKNNIYHYIPDINDFRDQYVNFDTMDFSDVIDLRGNLPPIFNIYDWNGSITSAITAILYQELLKQNKNIFIPSRLFIYYNSLVYNSKYFNNGIVEMTPSIRQTLKSIKKWGFCSEQYLPFNLQNKLIVPEDKCYAYAKNYTIDYYSIPKNINDIKLVLNHKKSIIISIPIYTNFQENNIRLTGRLSYPDNTDSIMGALSIVIVGYINEKELFIVRFPFGDLWGDHGYGYISYNYIIDMGMDLWIIDVIYHENVLTNSNMLVETNIVSSQTNNKNNNTMPIHGRYI